MPTMYEPQSGMATFVPNGMENDYLAKGYRATPPEQPNLVVVVNPQPQNQQTPANNEGGDSTELVKVNSASLKELTERLGLSTAQAKDLRDGRPYATVEDLIAKIPDIDWTTLNSKISYEA